MGPGLYNSKSENINLAELDQRIVQDVDSKVISLESFKFDGVCHVVVVRIISVPEFC